MIKYVLNLRTDYFLNFVQTLFTQSALLEAIVHARLERAETSSIARNSNIFSLDCMDSLPKSIDLAIT